MINNKTRMAIAKLQGRKYLVGDIVTFAGDTIDNRYEIIDYDETYYFITNVGHPYGKHKFMYSRSSLENSTSLY